MRFNLEIRNIQGSKRIILRFLCTYPRSFGHVDAILDTGEPITILSANDALRLRMPFNNFFPNQDYSAFELRGEFKKPVFLRSCGDELLRLNEKFKDRISAYKPTYDYVV